MRKLAAKTEGPLAGLVVVDLTRVLAGPYCTLILADLGARVIKVEAPGCGDDSRDAGPFIPSGDEHPPTSAYFFSVNRNKESIALDLKDRADREVLDALIADADILVENFRPGVLERLGLQWETLHARHPGLILASISGFGQTGPYSREVAYDIIVQAMGGVMSLTGSEAGEPTRVGISIGDLAAGMFGALGVMAAVIERNRTGLGKYVDVAMLDSQIALLENALARYQVDGKAPSAIGSRHPSITPFAPYRVRDGRIVIAAGNEAMFRRLCEVLAMPQLLTDPRFATNGARTEHHAELAEAMEARLCERTGAEWVQRLRSAGVACGPVNDVAALMGDPHVAAREMLAELPVPGGMKLKVANSPIKFFGEPVARSSPAPRLDEHRQQLLREIGMPPAEAPPPPSSNANETTPIQRRQP